MRKGVAFLLIFLFSGIWGCGKGKGLKECSLPEASPYAYLKAGESYNGETSILNGRLISPAGTQFDVGTFPLGIAISPDGKYVAVSNNGAEDIFTKELPDSISQSIYVYSITEEKNIAVLAESSLFVGLSFSPDGKFLYASAGGGDAILLYDVQNNFKKKDEWVIAGYPTGIVAGKKYVYATLLHEHSVVIFDPTTGEDVKTVEVGPYPYGITVDSKEEYLYVSNWGANYISIVNLTGNSPSSITVPVGKNPEGIALSPDNSILYVANTDSDSVSVIQVPEGIEIERISLNNSETPGIQPTDIALSPDGKDIFVTLSGENAVAMISADTYQLKGLIPTGYYPSGVEVHPQKKEIYVINARGDKGYANENDEFIVQLIRGTLSVIPYPDEVSLADYSEAVSRNNNVTRQFYDLSGGCGELDIPVPLKFGEPSDRIKHVVYIVRENKTYDAYLGDYEKGNGDPSLAIFGGDITPNTHALAEQFSLADNYYEEVEQSLQGHIWISLGWINDFMERNWSAMWARAKEAQFYLPGAEPAAELSGKMLFENLYESGISFRIYGDVQGILGDFLGRFRKFVNFRFPTWALHIKDADKAKIFIEDLEKGIFPQFVYIWLPNDHTKGTTAGAPTPDSMIADNDEAVGMVVDAISHSAFWKDTVIFIFEDDPQGTPDHIDAHRSPLLIVSPYVKKGYVSHVHYSFPSIHKTMELILGLKPMSIYDYLASPIYDVFTDKPNYEPYTYIPRKIPEKICCSSLVPPELLKKTIDINFDLPDQDSLELGEILREYMKNRSK